MNNPIARLNSNGVSVWLDDLSRDRLETGGLSALVHDRGVVGVTTNPTIFAGALSQGTRYDKQLAQLASAGSSVDEAVFKLTTDDVRSACDVLKPAYKSSDGVDGKVSIEVDPRLAFDPDRTIEQAHELWKSVDRPNLLIKIPATEEGLPAVRAALGSGISVNVTLIFGLDQYRGVIEAFLAGLEDAASAGLDLSTIHSVASFFVSRVDTDVDNQLEAIGTDEALALRGRAGVANARLAYRIHEETLAGDRFAALAKAGARPQRPLWASTSVKNPDYPPTLYVDNLVAHGTVNTMPEKTLRAVFDSNAEMEPSITNHYDEADAALESLAGLGISYDETIARLEREGVEKFQASWDELLETVQNKLGEA